MSASWLANFIKIIFLYCLDIKNLGFEILFDYLTIYYNLRGPIG